MQQLKMRVVVLLCLAALSYAASSQEPTYEQIYLQGTSAYNHQDWQNTIQHMRYLGVVNTVTRSMLNIDRASIDVMYVDQLNDFIE